MTSERIVLEKEVIERPSKRLLEELNKISSATAWGTLTNMGFRSVWMEGIKPLYSGIKVVGPAITLKYIAFREDRMPSEPESRSPVNWVWEITQRGDIIVADACGRLDSGVIGDCMATGYKAKGAAGFVVDGVVRDSPYIRQLMFPVFLRGVTPTSTRARLIPFTFNVPIQCCGVQVVPGDIIIGDDDGVVVIPRQKAEEVAEKGVEEETLEDYSRRMLLSGRSLGDSYPPRPEWLEKPPI
jgi:regulator of RNase E activity RraA